MVQRVMKEAWADDDELGWAGLGPDWLAGWQQKGQAADGTDCTRQVLHHTPGQSWGQPAPPCPAEPEPEPADLGTQRYTTDKCSRVSRSPSSPC